MCIGGGGGPSAEEMYKKQKVDFGALPSLTMEPTVDRGEKSFTDLRATRSGSKRRSLLAPMALSFSNAGQQ